MSSPDRQQTPLCASPLLAFSEWLMVLPASVFLAAAVLRLLQPREFQPAHLCREIVEWTVSHISQSGAAMIFLVLPASAVAIGFGALLQVWSRSASFRHDVYDSLGILRRNAITVMVLGATLVAGLIFAAVVLHLIMG
jgi:hypothetical protein